MAERQKSSSMYLETLPLEYEEWTRYSKAVVEYAEALFADPTLDSYENSAHDGERIRAFRYSRGEMLVDVTLQHCVDNKRLLLRPSKRETYFISHAYFPSDVAKRRPAYTSCYTVNIHNGLYVDNSFDTMRPSDGQFDANEMTEYDYRAILQDLRALVDNTRKINI